MNNVKGTLNRSRGYSSFKFIPETKDKMIVATKTEEDQTSRKMKSFITGDIPSMSHRTSEQKIISNSSFHHRWKNSARRSIHW